MPVRLGGPQVEKHTNVRAFTKINENPNRSPEKSLKSLDIIFVYVGTIG